MWGTTIFDLIAVLVASGCGKLKPLDYKYFNCLSEPKRRELKSHVEDMVALMKQDLEEDPVFLSQETVDRVLQYAKQLSLVKQENRVELLVLLEQLERISEPLIRTMTNVYKVERGGDVVLNRNSDDCHIALCYNCKYSSAVKSYGQIHSLDFNTVFRDLFVIDLNETKGIQLVHHLLDPKLAEEKSYLRIGVSPLWGKPIYNWNQKNDDYKMDDIYYTGNASLENHDIVELIFLAGEKGIGILVLPEMCGNKEMLEFVSNELLSARHKKKPMLTVLPSVWDNGTNIATVMDADGNVICQQYKRIPFQDGMSGYLEGLADCQELQERHVIHLENLGRVMIFICRDFLETKEVAPLMEAVKPSLVLVPSYTAKDFPFHDMRDLIQAYDCGVCWVDAAGVEENGCTNMAFIARTVHSVPERGDRVVYFKKDDRPEECITFQSAKGEEIVIWYADLLLKPLEV